MSRVIIIHRLGVDQYTKQQAVLTLAQEGFFLPLVAFYKEGRAQGFLLGTTPVCLTSA